MNSCPPWRGVERLLSILVLVNILVILLVFILILLLVLHLALKEFILVHFTEAHLCVVLVRVLVAVFQDFFIVAWRETIYLNNFHEDATKFEFLAALQEKGVCLLLCWFTDAWGRCLAAASPCRLMHNSSIIATLCSAASCTIICTICSRVVITGVAFSTTVANISGGITSLTCIRIRND